VQLNLTVVYSEPLKKDRRTKVESYVKGDPETRVEVAREDAKAIEEAKPLPVEPSKPAETDHTFDVFLSPKRGSFEGEGAQWSFRKGGRHGEVIQANIKDTDFLRKLETGEYRLSGNDILKVRLQEKQKVVGTNIRTTNDILRVLEYRQAPVDGSGQINLFEEN
jgi:hypothetical protein